MIRLTVDNKDIVLPVDASISIEKNSPVLNEEVGAFSYPFPVPTSKNRIALSYPGRLERAKDIPVKSFVLEENGTRIITGEVEIDQVTIDETGLILQSGKTEFTKRMKDKYLGDINYGHEEWPDGPTPIVNKLAYWDAQNTTDNGKYVAAPFITSFTAPETGIVTANAQSKVAGQPSTIVSGVDYSFAYFSLQFKVSFVYRSILLKSGYTIKEDQFIASEFNKAVLFGNLVQFGDLYPSEATPDFLEYSALMPRVKVLDFLQTVSNLFCVVFEINEQRKEVYVSFKKDIFLAENLSSLRPAELTGWEHKEHRPVGGFSLAYSSQDSDLDTEYDYRIDVTNLYTFPDPVKEGQTCRHSVYDRDYIVVKNDAGTLEWREIGRLKEFRQGNGENKIELDVSIPAQKVNKYYTIADTYECPDMQSVSYTGKSWIKSTPDIYISLYHGRKTFSDCQVPYLTFDHYSINGTINTGMSLKPSYLYEKVYKEFINWQAYRARECTKYLKLTLSEVISLQWRKRYAVSGVPILLDQVSFEIPYTGIVKIRGFTA